MDVNHQKAQLKEYWSRMKFQFPDLDIQIIEKKKPKKKGKKK